MCSVFPIPGFPMVRPGGCGWDVPHVVPAARPQTKSQVGEGKEASPPTGSLKEDTQLRFLVCGPHPSGAETWRSSESRAATSAFITAHGGREEQYSRGHHNGQVRALVQKEDLPLLLATPWPVPVMWYHTSGPRS